MAELNNAFRVENITHNDYQLKWSAVSGYDSWYITGWTLRRWTGTETYVDVQLATTVRDRYAVADLSLSPAAQTEYSYTLIAKFQDDYDGASWTKSSDKITLTTDEAPAVPVVSVNGDWPNYEQWIAGNLTLKTTLPSGFSGWSLLSHLDLYHKIGSADWVKINRMTINEVIAVQPNDILYEFSGLDSSVQHQFKAEFDFNDIVQLTGTTLSINIPITQSNSFGHLPYVYAIPSSIGTPANIFIGNISSNVVHNPQQGQPLPGDLTEWRQVGTALHVGTLHKIYRRAIADKDYRTWQAEPTQAWDAIQYNILHTPGLFIPQETDQWWNTTQAATARVYVADPNFVPNGNNNPFRQVSTLLPFAGQWAWPASSVAFTGFEDSADTGGSTPTVAVATYLDSTFVDRPLFTAANLDDAAFEIYNSVIEDYVRKLQVASLSTVTYKLYVFIPHEHIFTDTFKLVEADGTVHALTQESADITFNERTGRLFSKTFTADPVINQESFATTMNITAQQYSVQDASAFSFGTFSWPSAPIPVADLDNGSPFYLTTAGVLAVKAPTAPYTNQAAHSMIVPLLVTDTYPSPVLT